MGKWPAERPSRGERRQATYPQRGSAEKDGHRRSAAMVRVARQSFKRGYDDVYVEDPVSCGLMSGLRRGIRRWPSWVSACVLYQPGKRLTFPSWVKVQKSQDSARLGWVNIIRDWY